MEHSNADHPIPPRQFALMEWRSQTLLPFRHENQYVCTWAVVLDGSEDPPVYVDVDSGGREWRMAASKFSEHVYSCVWDYRLVLGQPALVEAQNAALTPAAIERLRASFTEELRTYGWPGNAQYRFARERQAVLIWAGEHQADWFIAAPDEAALESVLRMVWTVDDVGDSLYDCSPIGKAVLSKLRREA